MTDERSEEQRASASPLTVMVGGEARAVPILTIRQSRDWKKLVQEKIGLAFTDLGNVSQLMQAGGLLNIAGDALMDLVLAYDQTGVLGTREELEDSFTDADLYRAFRRMLDITFPFVGDLQSLVAMLGTPAPSAQASSTNGHSQTGPASVRKASKPSLMSS